MKNNLLSPLCLRDIKYRKPELQAKRRPRIEERIIDKIRPERYIEPFGWTGELFFHKEPSSLEVFNDHGMLFAHLFTTLKDAKRAKNIAWLFESLYDGYEPTECHFRFCADVCKEFLNYKRSIEQVAKFLKSSRAQNYQLFHAEPSKALAFATIYGIHASANRQTPFEEFDRIGNIIPSWNSQERMKTREEQGNAIRRAGERFKDVVVETRDPVDCIQTYDDKDALFFVYPPMRTPQDKRYFATWTEKDDARLLDALKTIKGRVILPLGCRNVAHYDSLLDLGWRVVEADLLENLPIYDSFYVFVKI